MSKPLSIEAPYLLFLGEAESVLSAKTAGGIAYWRPERCLGQYRLPGCQVDLGLPDMAPAEAAARGARSLVIGLAPAGGALPATWEGAMTDALAAGLDIASGLHTRLTNIPEIAASAEDHGRRILDVREPPKDLPCGSGERRSGKRLLTVGTDCCVGKMYAALAVAREMNSRGMKADFRATGQTGILIAGSGIAVDAVVSDFLAGAAEVLAPAAAADHWDVIEGQGSLHHPAYAGVSLGLLHGSQPDALVLCHEAGRQKMDWETDYSMPSLEESAEINLAMARRTNPEVRLAGVSINTSKLSEKESLALIDDVAARLGVPAADPVRGGVGPIVDLIETI